MELPWGDEKTVQFITNVGLITTTGPHGPNIMSAEWTHHVSYSPGLIAVCIGPGKATYENIRETKEFGVNIAATDQNVIASIAGGSTGKEVDKIKSLEALGFNFYKGKKIRALMVKGAAVNIECRLFKVIPLGDHTMFVGEAVEASLTLGKEPLAYHKGKYWLLGEIIQKPAEDQLQKIRETIEKFKKS